MLLALLALAFWALAPGLSGGFLFDDYANLPALGAYGPVNTVHAFFLYITSGAGDPTGRPLAMLSFLLDANDWPATAGAFLRTNILLHLLNGTLLWLMLKCLGAAASLPKRHAEMAALLGSALWLLHPLFLSTTLYIVQREAMLSASFVLAGFLLWLTGRHALALGRNKRGYCLLAGGAIGCAILGTLCKANGALLPLLLLVAEATVLHAPTPDSAAPSRSARNVLLVVPTLVLGIYLLASIPGAIRAAAEYRPWTIGQRVLSEARVITDYLGLLIAPRSVSQGPFHDDFLGSVDILHPWTTVPAILLLAGFALSAWRLRRRYPDWSFAFLFFLGAHVLEGTVLPLELYFEHRNYLAAMPLFWPLAIVLTRPDGRMVRLRAIASISLVLALASLTRVGAGVWGNPPHLAEVWATKNPESPRAQAYMAQYEFAYGRYTQERARLEHALKRRPEEVQLAFNLVDAECHSGGIRTSTLDATLWALEHNRDGGKLIFEWLSAKTESLNSERCPGLDANSLASMLHAARTNPHFTAAPGRLQDFDHVAGLLALAQNDATQAAADFDQALLTLPKPEVALSQAAKLGAFGRPDLGLRHLDLFRFDTLAASSIPLSMPAVHAWLLQRSGYWQTEFAQLHESLLQDMRKKNTDS